MSLNVVWSYAETILGHILTGYCSHKYHQMFSFHHPSCWALGQYPFIILVLVLLKPHLSYKIKMQCPKLRVHPAPDVHISTAGCTILGGVHPVCARFLSNLLLLYIGRVRGSYSACTVLCEVHPASAQNKSLISDTEGSPIGYALSACTSYQKEHS